MLDVLRAWLGSGGKPVEREEAAARLAVCINCQENRPGKWWEVHFTEPIAEEIRKHLAVKHHVGLELEGEEKTGMCRACGCCIRLKVWCPSEHIKDHTDQALKEKFPQFCWIKRIL